MSIAADRNAGTLLALLAVMVMSGCGGEIRPDSADLASHDARAEKVKDVPDTTAEWHEGFEASQRADARWDASWVPDASTDDQESSQVPDADREAAKADRRDVEVGAEDPSDVTNDRIGDARESPDSGADASSSDGNYPIVYTHPGSGIQVTYSQRGTPSNPVVVVDPACTMVQPYLNYFSDGPHATCADIAPAGELVGSAEVCFPGDGGPSQPELYACRYSASCDFGGHIGPRERQSRPGLCCATPLVVPRDTNGDGIYDLHCVRVNHFDFYAYALIGGLKDADNDFFPDLVDTCPTVSNTLTQNQDDDGDRVGNICDNCPNVFNPDQQDANNNGIGDRCDPSTP